jgi:predicted transcriptional regulator
MHTHTHTHIHTHSRIHGTTWNDFQIVSAFPLFMRTKYWMVLHNMSAVNRTSYAKRNTRGKMQILANIIELCTMGQKRKTHIIYKSNLSGKQGQHYIDVLLTKGLISKDLSDDISGVYRTTQKGREYLSHYYRMIQLIEEKEEEQLEEENKQDFSSRDKECLLPLT